MRSKGQHYIRTVSISRFRSRQVGLRRRRRAKVANKDFRRRTHVEKYSFPPTGEINNPYRCLPAANGKS